MPLLLIERVRWARLRRNRLGAARRVRRGLVYALSPRGKTLLVCLSLSAKNNESRPENEVLHLDVAAQFPLDKWPGFLEMLGRSLAGLLVLALIPVAIFDSEDRVVFLKAILG